MLYLIFYYFIITSICAWAGLLFYVLFGLADFGMKSLLHFLLTGLMGLTCIAQWVLLFFPVNLFTLAILFIVCTFISVIKRKCLNNALSHFFKVLTNKPILFYVSFLCFVTAILILNAGPVIMDDTDSYHIQAVKWIQEYGSVPGIANLHLRFGFNSSWFISIALFSYPSSKWRSYVWCIKRTSLNMDLLLFIAYNM